jgi:hypothetical protein
MPVTLYERLVGDLPADATEPSERKISLHGFRAVLTKVLEGELTNGQAVTLLALDSGQAAEAQTLLTAISSIPGVNNKRRFLDWLFSDLVLGELGWYPSMYQNRSAFNARFNAEVSRARGF